MTRGSTPGALEQTALLTLAGFDQDAQARDVYEALVAATGRDVSVAAVHITLARLEDKGWAASRTADPEPGQGGKPRRFYRLTPDGAAIIVDLRRQMDRLWESAAGHPLLDDGA